MNSKEKSSVVELDQVSQLYSHLYRVELLAVKSVMLGILFLTMRHLIRGGCNQHRVKSKKSSFFQFAGVVLTCSIFVLSGPPYLWTLHRASPIKGLRMYQLSDQHRLATKNKAMQQFLWQPNI